MTARSNAQALAKTHLANGDPLGWFDSLYAKANGDESQIPWADLQPNANLISWLNQHNRVWNRAITIGCGLGDDAEELARRGSAVTAFDISPTAIDWCRRRFPQSAVNYQIANVLEIPRAWERAFDFVYECYTLQVLPPDLRAIAIQGCASLLAHGGTLLIICRGRDAEGDKGNMPWPLTRDELESLTAGAGLIEVSFEDYLDGQAPPVRRFRIEYLSTN